MLFPDEFFSLKGFAHSSLWREGEPVWSALHELSNYLKGAAHRIEIEIPPGVYLQNGDQISIGKGTVIDPGVLIQGPCIIGKNCAIRHGAYIREGVILGDGCIVGHATEMKHAILLNGAHATHLCYVGDSILGSGVNLGAGVKCANLRLDRREIFVSYAERKIGTGLKKFGAIVGDNTQIGCNSVLNPGTIFGKDCFCHPLVNIGGVIPAASEVKKTVSSRGVSILERILQRR